MITSEGKKEGERQLSADEEQRLGRILASRIQATAKRHVLYQKYPKDAALFLKLWARYGSRDATNRYLTSSFQSSPENVIKFLKCYLTTPDTLAPGTARPTGFSRSQYDWVSKVVDTDNVYEALARLYERELEKPESMEFDGSPDKAIAFQFARIHHLVKSETDNPEKKA